MATQFVKWCKTKFHVGSCSYKTMTVLGSNLSDGRPSDTEDLVKDDTSSYGNGAHINPCLISPTPSCSENDQESQPEEEEEHENDEHLPQVKFEDFECNVQLEESDSGEEKKEFSFTFYDLDGYGKITKDDVAGLVRSIYGAVNDSIKVPQGGKKTIKVKLTVTPENKGSLSNSGDGDPNENVNVNNNQNNNNSPEGQMGNRCSSAPNEGHGPTKVRNNVNVTIQENLHRERSCRRGEKDFFRDRFCRSDNHKFNSVRIPNPAGCRGCRNFSPEVIRDCSASPLRNRKKWRERPCSFHRPELVDLKHACMDLLRGNMEKNNASPCCRHEHSQNSHQPPISCLPNQLHDLKCPSALFRNESFWKQKLVDFGCNRHSVNLGGNGNRVHDCPNQRNNSSHHHPCKKHGHHRSRSHDLSHNLLRHHLRRDNDQLPVPPVVSNQLQQCCNNNHIKNMVNHEESLEIQQGCILNHQQISPRSKNTNVTNSASPHQLKHRNREVEHARAMSQVINWLERENIGEGRRFSSPKKKVQCPNNPSFESPPVVKKHEHHHHHVHHHYHHYNGNGGSGSVGVGVAHSKETPIIV